MEGGNIAVTKALKYTRRENHKEVGPKAVPVEVTQAGHLADNLLTADSESDPVTQRQSQPLSQSILNRNRYCTGVCLGVQLTQPAFWCRYFRYTRLPGIKPLPGDDPIAFRQLGLPGEVKLAAQRVVAPRLRRHSLTRRLAVDLGKAPTHHGIERAAVIGVSLQCAAEGIAFAGLNVDGKVVGRIVGQLCLPSGQQVATYHGDHRHGEEGD